MTPTDTTPTLQCQDWIVEARMGCGAPVATWEQHTEAQARRFITMQEYEAIVHDYFCCRFTLRVQPGH